MKKAVYVTLLLLVISALAWIIVFSRKNLRGIGPAVRAPSEDIAQLIGSDHGGGTAGMQGPLFLPKGFSISIFANGLGDPRVLSLAPDNTLLVSIPSQGKVVALPDRNADGIADYTVTVAEGLNRPHGLAFRNSQGPILYIAEIDQVNMYSYGAKNMKASGARKIADLPGRGGHVTRTLLFLPGSDDEKLLISVGSSCNVCIEEDWRRAKILVVPAAGGELRTFASGLRNAVFMTTQPKTKKVWATDMGRDYLGDDLPPDEINIIEPGRNYGWPFCYGKNVHDSHFDHAGTHSCREPETVPSFIDIPAHSAPLGIAFFPEEGWPPEFRDNFLVAFHGSWNRSVPTGYKIVRYRPDGSGGYTPQDFVTGWLRGDGTALGRPVDILFAPEKKIFVSDDKAGVIYLIRGPQ
jgi:glucose/arabinose dehydrogenase